MAEINEAKSASTESFVTALVFNAIVFGVEIGVFTLIRPYFKAIYEPRTYAPAPSERSEPLSRNIFLWPVALWRADFRSIKHANGMDAYCFVRFLRMMVKVFLPIWIISWIVLLPTTAVGTSNPGKDNLDKLTFGNVSPDQYKRYAAHLILAWFFTFWVLYNIVHEMRHFITARQQHIIEPNHAKSLQANTILVTGIPDRYLNRRSLLDLFDELPGGVKKIWINRNLKELPEIYSRRLSACNKLESAETALLRTAAKIRQREEKKKSKASKKTVPVSKEHTHTHSEDLETAAIVVPHGQRPTHRLGFLPFTGKKVDTIDWAREEIVTCNRLLEEGCAAIRADDEASNEVQNPGEFSSDASSAKLSTFLLSLSTSICNNFPAVGLKPVAAIKNTTTAIKARFAGYGDSKYPPFNSAFVTFHKQIAAHLAVRVLTHHEPYSMTNKYNEVSPQDVIWANLNMNPYEQKIRMAISYAITAALIIFWVIPVGRRALSNVPSLCNQFSWLAWICGLPPVIVGIISGVLPPVLLAILMALLPIVLRLLARFEGIPKYTGLELSLMTRFFIFQVVHSFLIVTVTSGIVAALEGLVESPTSTPNILANELPKASTFFLTYIILQGLAGSGSGFLQIVRLVIYYVKLIVLGSTPRSVYNIKYVLGNVAWGTLFPTITLLTVISLAYSIISPVINGLACATFFAFYQLYKYLFLWVYEQNPSGDTGGLFFPKAIQHVFVGLYIEEICLCALFFLARDPNDNASAVIEGALMIVLIVLTAGFHAIFNNSYDPLLQALPLSLKDKTYSPATGMTEGRNPRKSEAGNDNHEIVEEMRGIEGDDEDDVSSKHKGKRPENEKVGQVGEGTAARHTREDAEFGFAHPAISRPQRTLWIPRDTLGLGEGEVAACEDMGLNASMSGAVMNEKGKVDVPTADDVPGEIVVRL
ncbi:hypothetical protein AGABI2DRAFT_225252 [Agaricus bisporus var. bisporus H97]|uniref:hypothetical protein n=1 Tax=Agaricus bisporus var. bisporus (strain H97 / ATCC MYA-4626 / FGSC 10389) TaxID=936046 RepID=UPI00029F7F34|nr:hypothetical protein AGABI2DRAFT_225252 [Agaricus bisporus var. bisporus H97]EKV45311.1 hypothetical protein AGABI2DRAFT_225252 [Agaricus bisporus var. bisporus H97]